MLRAVAIWVTWHLPQPILYWAVIRAFALASKVYSSKAMGDLTFDDVATAIYWERKVE